MAETPQNTARALLVAPSVGFAEDAAGYWFDKKFVEGMRLFRTLWGGPLVSAMKRVEKASLPFGDYYTLDELPFELIPRAPGEELSASQVASAAAVLAAGDNHDQLGLCLDEAERRPPVCYILEHDQPTRYQLVWLDGRPLGARLKSLVWTWLIDRRRKAAVSRAEAIQANGAPAMASYSPLQPNALLFFDTRMRDEMLATPAEMEARAARLRSGAPLRLVFSGRFERIKGVRHLPLVAAALKKRGVDFSFEIFGTGSLESEVA
ncbi:MAG TPA: hypothetical protein VNH64_10480, partial [Parvularculaceae bacterium]|nr:hypothetical protein [Parvularculaceae bacterium]